MCFFSDSDFSFGTEKSILSTVSHDCPCVVSACCIDHNVKDKSPGESWSSIPLVSDQTHYLRCLSLYNNSFYDNVALLEAVNLDVSIQSQYY